MCRLGLTPRRVTSALGRTNSTLVGANVSSISTSTSNATSFSAAPSRLAFSLPRARSRWLACGSLLWDACPFPISGCPFSRGVPRFSRSFWRPTHTSCEWIFALPCFFLRVSPCAGGAPMARSVFREARAVPQAMDAERGRLVARRAHELACDDRPHRCAECGALPA